MGPGGLSPDESEGGLEQELHHLLRLPDDGGKPLIAEKSVKVTEASLSLLKIPASKLIVRHGRNEYTFQAGAGQNEPLKQTEKETGRGEDPHAPPDGWEWLG